MGRWSIAAVFDGAAADTSWTYALVDALAAARVPGIVVVEPNLVMHPR